MDKHVFTTGVVSKILSVAPRTVSKWVDTGRLKGHRIPGSQDRRVVYSDLITFVKSNNIQISPQGQETLKKRGINLHQENGEVYEELITIRPGDIVTLMAGSVKEYVIQIVNPREFLMTSENEVIIAKIKEQSVS